MQSVHMVSEQIAYGHSAVLLKESVTNGHALKRDGRGEGKAMERFRQLIQNMIHTIHQEGLVG